MAMQDKRSRGRRLADRIGLFCTDYWNADGSIRELTEEEGRQEDIAYERYLASFDELSPEEMDALEAKADADDAEHAFYDRLARAQDTNPQRGLPVPVHMRRSVWGHPEYAEEALRLAKQKRAKASL